MSDLNNDHQLVEVLKPLRIMTADGILKWNCTKDDVRLLAKQKEGCSFKANSDLS